MVTKRDRCDKPAFQPVLAAVVAAASRRWYQGRRTWTHTLFQGLIMINYHGCDLFVSTATKLLSLVFLNRSMPEANSHDQHFLRWTMNPTTVRRQLLYDTIVTVRPIISRRVWNRSYLDSGGPRPTWFPHSLLTFSS